MQEFKVDVAVIGAGTAGLNARRSAERNGASTVILDPGPYGTTCARVGCMPSKLLIAASERAYSARGSGLFGISASVKIDGRKVMTRIQKERGRFVKWVLEAIDDLRKRKLLIPEKTSFVGPNLLQAGQCLIKAKTIVIATGASSVIPEPYQGLGNILLSHENIFELKDLPKSCLVAGGGLIGLELGQALHRLGVRVTILGRHGVIGPLKDPRVRKEAKKIFSAELDFYPNHKLKKIRKTSNGAEVSFSDSRGPVKKRWFERILIAAGRRPNLRSLNIHHAGVSLDKKTGIPEFNPETLQIKNAPIFIAGDVNRYRAVLHEASFEGEIAGENAAKYPKVKPYERWIPLSIVFTDPQMAVVGKSWKDIKGHRGYVCGDVNYETQGRSQVMAVNKGWVRIYGEVKSGRVVGAEMLGPRVEHTAHLLAWAIEQKLTVFEMLEMPFYHPVIEEGIYTCLEDLSRKMKHRKTYKN
jgi:dihydrolipoamide dehydrogenase